MPGELDPAMMAQALRGGDHDVESSDGNGLAQLVDEAVAVAAGAARHFRRGAETGVTLARLAVHSPGNVAWRSLNRLAVGAGVSATGLWRAAAILASGLRTLFNRPETIALLGRLMPDEDYRGAVLR